MNPFLAVPPDDVQGTRDGPVLLAAALAARSRAAAPLEAIGALLGARSWSASQVARSAKHTAEKHEAVRKTPNAFLEEIP